MTTKEQPSLFDADSPYIVPESLQAQNRQAEDFADREDIPYMNVKERRENMAVAIALLARISRLNGLDKMTTNPDMAEVRSERAAHYPEGVFDAYVVPGAKGNRSKLISREMEPALDKVFGDVEASRRSAWADFTPEERAELELSQPDRDDLSIAFRARFTRKEGSKARTEQLKRLSGKPKRRKAA